MTCNCSKNVIRFVRGNDTNWNGVDFIKSYFTSTQLDLSTFKAVFKLCNIVKTFDDITEGIVINLTAQETALMPQFCNGSLQLIDSENRIATIENQIPFEAVSVVHGDAIVTQPYELTFDVTQQGMTILNFEVKVASGGAGSFSELAGSPYDNENLADALNSKQDALVSGTNIKTVNNISLLGSGNIQIVGGVQDVRVDSISVVTDGIANVPFNYVQYSAGQELTTQQKSNARTNIDAVGTGQIKQSTGESTTDLISQKGISDLLANKQDAKPDGTNLLIASDTGKINLVYIPSTVLGGITNGGTFNGSGIITASSYAPELQGEKIDEVAFASYPSYYFICSSPYSFAGFDFAVGDWQ